MEMGMEYLLLVDEVNMAILSKVMPGIRYLPVEGINMEGEKMVLVTQKPKVIEPVLENEIPKCE